MQPESFADLFTAFLIYYGKTLRYLNMGVQLSFGKYQFFAPPALVF